MAIDPQSLQAVTAITDPAANIAIIICAVALVKMAITQATHGVRLKNLEREVFGHET